MDEAINIDIGTSGIRVQLLNLMDSSVLRTAILSRNPLPGANVVGQMDFAVSYGQGMAHGILVSAVNSLINNLKPGNLKSIAVCGNPTQLSLFEGIEIRDLAFAGKNALEKMTIKPPKRDRIYTGSAAADPAIEGQHISKGMLAKPGVIADLRLSGGW
jgi:methylamine methyltransferase corrinoid activation protein